MNTTNNTENDKTLVEDILLQSGKSKEEASSVGKVEAADESFENTFARGYRTEDSPIHHGVWTNKTPVFEFACMTSPTADKSFHGQADAAVNFVKNAKWLSTLFDERGKLTEESIHTLGQCGYWGMLVPKEYGGADATIFDFMRVLTKMGKEADASVAGLASIHQCIGAVDPITHFGSPALKERYLPLLARGTPTSGFALTEPAAGSDLTAIRTTARLEGDHYVVTGKKMFISNSYYGRILGLVVMLNGKPSVMIAELPGEDTETFRLEKYKIHALKHLYNHALHFDNFVIPKENLIEVPYGDGLTIAYHGLNRGRIAIAANATGMMSYLLSNIIRWADYRKTYGQPIKERELVKARVARAAGLIVETEALRDWTSSLLDQGHRGELECMMAKIRGSTNLADLALSIGLKTHGGRTFLDGNPVGDDLYDILAPTIYEGENDVLKLAFFKTLVKSFGLDYLKPMLDAQKKASIDPRQFKAWRPDHLFAVRKPAIELAAWVLDTEATFNNTTSHTTLHPSMGKHVDFAMAKLLSMRKLIYRAVLKYQHKLADHQMFITEEISSPVQDLITILVLTQHASENSGDEVTLKAADLRIRELVNRLSGKRPCPRFRKDANRLADAVYAGKFEQIDGAFNLPIQRRY